MFLGDRGARGVGGEGETVYIYKHVSSAPRVDGYSENA